MGLTAINPLPLDELASSSDVLTCLQVDFTEEKKEDEERPSLTNSNESESDTDLPPDAGLSFILAARGACKWTGYLDGLAFQNLTKKIPVSKGSVEVTELGAFFRLTLTDGRNLDIKPRKISMRKPESPSPSSRTSVIDSIDENSERPPFASRPSL